MSIFKGIDIDFHKFLDENWIEVPYSFLAIDNVSSMIQNET
jgi:hypothetical protein